MHSNTKIILVNGHCYKILYCMSFYCDINRPITNCDPRDNNALIRGNLCEHRHISLKTRFLELYVFVANSMGLTLTTLTLQLAAKAIEFGKITQKWPIRHSRSFNVTDLGIKSIESPYATSY